MSDNEPIILIGMHSHGTIKIETALCLVNAISPIPYKKKFVIEKNAYCQYGKNKMVEKAISGGFTHLMIIDGDMVFPAESIMQLVESGKDVVGGLYYRRQPTPSPTISMMDARGIPYTPQEFPKDRPFKVLSVGGGFICISVDVLKKLTEPYFWLDFYNGVMLGDDVYFNKKVNDAGFEVWCDPTIKLYHIGDYPY